MKSKNPAKVLGTNKRKSIPMIYSKHSEEQFQDPQRNAADNSNDRPKPVLVVNGEELLDSIVLVFTDHLILPPYAAETQALWVIFANSHDAWHFSPRLITKSAGPESGKSRNMKIMKVLVRSATRTEYATEAVLRRVLDEGEALLLDEADTFFQGKNEFKSALNSGFERGGASLLTKLNETTNQREIEKLSTWAPVMIAGIGSTWLWEALKTRSMIFTMKKKLPHETVKDWDKAAIADAQRIADSIAIWVKQNMPALKNATPEMPKELQNRQLDKWSPLFAIADVVGGKWPNLARKMAVALSGEKPALADGPALLKSIKAILDETQDGKIWSEDLVMALDKRGHWDITQSTLAAALNEFEIAPKGVRIGDRNRNGYRVEQFADAFKRWLD